jgi:uncharacterized protein YndB with AHSA1/START domain
MGEKSETKVNRRAPVVARDEVFIEAPSGTVWALQTDISSWPRWRSDVSRAELEGELEVGSVFRWRSGGFNVISTVREIEPGWRLGWTGRAFGTRAVHTWTFEPREGGVLVQTEESFEGWLVRALRGSMRKTLEGSLRTWLAELKREAERGPDRA